MPCYTDDNVCQTPKVAPCQREVKSPGVPCSLHTGTFDQRLFRSPLCLAVLDCTGFVEPASVLRASSVLIRVNSIIFGRSGDLPDNNTNKNKNIQTTLAGTTTMTSVTPAALHNEMKCPGR